MIEIREWKLRIFSDEQYETRSQEEKLSFKNMSYFDYDVQK